MAVPNSFKCISCEGHHDRQAFVSHATDDAEIAAKLKHACCEIGVAPYLFEFSPESLSQARPADALAGSVAASAFIFVLLGKSVSEAYWTQAWIGFEVGISKGLAIETNRPKNVIVLQDIRQGIKVSVPMLDELFLFDFDSGEGWNQYKDLVLVLANLTSSGEFYKAASRFRGATLSSQVKCAHCKSQYEAWIAKDDVGKLEKGFNPIKELPELHAECTIECPSCDKMVTRYFRQMLPSQETRRGFAE